MEKARPKLRSCPQPSQQSSLSGRLPSITSSLISHYSLPSCRSQPCPDPDGSSTTSTAGRLPAPRRAPLNSDPALHEVPTAGAIFAFPHRPPPVSVRPTTYPADAGHTVHCAARTPGLNSRRCSAAWSSEHPPVPRSACRRRRLSPRDTPPPPGGKKLSSLG